MGQVQKTQPVTFIVGILAIDEDALAQANELIVQQLGPVESRSEAWPFSSTKYYAKEMSETLLRQFVSLAQLSAPGDLVKLKLASNSLELAHAQQRDRGRRRAINLDPGYITPAKLILASTKDFSHRLYLDRGIFGEVTLQYVHSSWRSFPWSFPDYAEPRYHRFFSDVRSRLLEQLRKQESKQ